ncbi:unnamed protein product [Rotaria sordida]|uniref:Uncharacterized protein n=1 Tax=Rotaria sordida TaxID=392033 RepID=A0A814T0M9_9BILA|nr:unnamed protein product [Rotaria sordida]CAF1132254.1 unnamed protein product [Rotaria sordida]CAF1155067.1 unnamed protein product [Rotaria sordida]CAF1190309.1 unnamed protein product [Rotaria sordida]CAF1354168.1 unnamed protein product [Rotaria sordida]
MISVITTLAMDGFNKSLDELLHFADILKLREKELEQQHILELEKQKTEYDIQIQIEKRRIEQLQEINRTLTEQVERSTQKQVDLEQKYTVLLTKYNCCVEESKQIKELHNEKKIRIEELEKIARMLTNEKTKLDNEIKQLKTDNQILEDKIKEIPPPPPPTPTPQRVPDEFIVLVEKAVAENSELKNLLTERDNEIQKLNEQLKRNQNEDPIIVEQRLLQLMTKLKNDFRTMYENQTNFFLQKIDLLKQEQRDNIASLYKH